MTNQATRQAHLFLKSIANHRHPKLAYVLEKNGEVGLESSQNRNLIEFMSKTVVSQQLATKAAHSIWRRILNLSEKQNESLEKVLDGRYSSDLLACGLSRSKEKTLRLMSQALRNGLISEEWIMQVSYDELVESVTSMWGFGPWSADMVAMFFVKLPDVWPESDVALIRGLQILAPGEEPATAAAHYSPHRTYLARHIWNALDTGLVTESAA